MSGALRREIELVLELAGLRPHFAEIVAAEDVGACKPDPQGYLQALAARWSWSRGGAWWSRTRCPGLAAARAAGLRCAVLTTSHPTDAFADADLVWPDFAGRRPARAPLVPCLTST